MRIFPLSSYNQPSLRYGVEDRLKEYKPLYSYTEGPELGHGRIETRTYNIYDGLEIIADKEKWGGKHDDYRVRGRDRQKDDRKTYT